MTTQRIKWQPVFKTKASVLFQWYVFEGHKRKYYRSSLGLNFGQKNQRIISDEISINPKEFVVLGKILLDKVRTQEDYYREFIDGCYSYANTLIEKSKQVSKATKVKGLSNKKLLKQYLEYQNSVLDLMPFLNTILVLDDILKKQIIQHIVKDIGIKDKREQDLLLSKLIIPKKNSFFIEETNFLLKIAQKYQKGKLSEIESDIKDYLKEFSWIHAVAYVGKYQTKKDVLVKIEELVKEDIDLKLAKTKQIQKEKIDSYKRAVAQVDRSKELLYLINIARELVYLETYRLYVFFQANFFANEFFKEIGKRFGLDYTETVYLTGSEILKWLSEGKSVSKKEVLLRMKNYALILDEGRFKLFSGDDVKAVIQRKVSARSVEGTVANVGRVISTVKLVHNVEDMEKVGRGDIVVSQKTRPDLTPALSRAGGIITDSGGILSHAAIVSREFGIPCIVGTKNATQVFADGDMVELNAYEGVARKL